MSNNQKETVLTQSLLKQMLTYDKQTGLFTRNRKNNPLAGSKDKETGYIVISMNINKKMYLYKAHRLAWLYEHGEWPIGDIDHINHTRGDNMIYNLRTVSRHTNLKNISLRDRNTSGFNGVCWNSKAKRWQSSITINQKTIYLGIFKDKYEAIFARIHANRLYKFHSNHGKYIISIDKHT